MLFDRSESPLITTFLTKKIWGSKKQVYFSWSSWYPDLLKFLLLVPLEASMIYGLSNFRSFALLFEAIEEDGIHFDWPYS